MRVYQFIKDTKGEEVRREEGRENISMIWEQAEVTGGFLDMNISDETCLQDIYSKRVQYP